MHPRACACVPVPYRVPYYSGHWEGQTEIFDDVIMTDATYRLYLALPKQKIAGASHVISSLIVPPLYFRLCLPLSAYLISCEVTNKVTDWYALGVFLKMSSEELKDIERRLSGEGIRRCKIELFTCWMKRYPNASWTEIALALDKCDENESADRIRQCHLPPTLPAATASMPPSQEQQPVKTRTIVLLDKKR